MNLASQELTVGDLITMAREHPRALAGAISLLIGVLAFATAVPGVFTIDECNYLVSVVGVREGGLTVPGTGSLPASNELMYFEPIASSLRISQTPVTWLVPPLYGLLAQPFGMLGFRGLILLNSLSFAALAFLVWSYVREHSRESGTAWTAAAVLVIGAYLLEYAQGAWPHALCALLIFGAFHLTSLVRRGRGAVLAFAAGVLAGTAAGIRYQNAFIGGAVGFGVLLAARGRVKAIAAYATGMAAVLALTATLNHARLGTWNPVSKTASYLTVTSEGGTGATRWKDALQTFWGRTVDYRAYPQFSEARARENGMTTDPVSGAVMIGRALKKSWLQSAPWLLLPLLALAREFLPRRLRAHLARRGSEDAATKGSEMLAAALVVFPTLALFSWAGSLRTDGLCFNQRYFIEIIPIMVGSLALVTDRFAPRWRQALIATVCGFGLVLASGLAGPLRWYVLSVCPLVLAAMLVIAWIDAERRAASRVLWAALGACVGWGFGAHVLDDLPASREFRRDNEQNLEYVRQRLPQKAAIFAWWGAKDALGPLQLEKDLVILDARTDEGRDAPALADAFLKAGRPVFVLTPGFPPPVIMRMAEGKEVRSLDPVRGNTIPPLIRLNDPPAEPRPE